MPEEHARMSLVNKHVYFAHVYKGQEGWRQVLERYKAGRTGVLYDYEFLWDQQGRNIGAGMSPFAGTPPTSQQPPSDITVTMEFEIRYNIMHVRTKPAAIRPGCMMTMILIAMFIY